MSWQEQAAAHLRKHLPAGAKLLVAVSGGSDSVVLAHFLLGQPYRLLIGHIDHSLRKGSVVDARFVKTLAARWDVPFRIQRVNVKGYARWYSLGVEEAARDLRYQALASMARKAHCAAIVTAHTANDQAETVLMHFLRGTGPMGLAGIPRERLLGAPHPTRLIRPLLGAKRHEIMQYLRRHSLPFRQDPTNRSLVFLRNRIRHSTLPYLERQAPGLADRLVQMADVFREEESFWNERVRREFNKTVRKNGPTFTVVLARLFGYHKALSRRILRHLLPGLSFQDIERVQQLARLPQETPGLALGRWRIKRKKNTLVVTHMRTG